MTPLSHPDSRLRELARCGASDAHVRAMHNSHEMSYIAADPGHVFDPPAADWGFSTCPHPDCVLVRAAVPVEEAAPLDLEPIKAREAAATKGLWYAHHVFRVHTVSEWASPVTDNAAKSICGPLLAENADFIAHARQDIPALITEIERLRASPGPVAGAADEPCAARNPGGELCCRLNKGHAGDHDCGYFQWAVSLTSVAVDEQALEALEFAHGAIVDAICCEDGLDSGAGEKVIEGKSNE